MSIDNKMQDWEGIARSLRTAGMNNEDVDAAESLSKRIHTLDKLAFQDDLPFTFYPTWCGNPGGYDAGKYFVYVKGLNRDLLKFGEELKQKWPLNTSVYIQPDLYQYSLASEIVRLRVQEQLPIGLFTPQHTGSIKQIPILNKIIEANAKIPKLTPERFDAHIIGTYASIMIYESKRDGIPGEQTVRLIGELVKLDANKV